MPGPLSMQRPLEIGLPFLPSFEALGSGKPQPVYTSCRSPRLARAQSPKMRGRRRKQPGGREMLSCYAAQQLLQLLSALRHVALIKDARAKGNLFRHRLALEDLQRRVNRL